MSKNIAKLTKITGAILLIVFSANSFAGGVYGNVGYRDYPLSVVIGYKDYGHGYKDHH